MRILRRLALTLAMVAAVITAGSIDTDELANLVGYTILASTHVTGSFEGADYDKTVRLDDGSIFQFRTYHYHYAYHPAAIIFGKRMSPDEMHRLGISNPPAEGLILYKLLIDDAVYDVARIR